MASLSNAQFHNVKPRTRAEREGMRDREGTEKLRLKERVGGFQQYADFAGISNPDPTSHAFLSESERFDTDFAAQERRRREEEFQRKQGVLNCRREQQINRDMTRWQQMGGEEGKYQQKLDNKQQQWKAGQKNNPSAAYNPLTLEYDQTQQGRELQLQDDQVKYRAGMRMFNLDQKMNSGFNVLTGEPRRPPSLLKDPNS